MNYTKGEWKVGKKVPSQTISEQKMTVFAPMQGATPGSLVKVATTDCSTLLDMEVREANAQLISAAPAMYEALKAIRIQHNQEWASGHNMLSEENGKLLDKALAQAEGR